MWPYSIQPLCTSASLPSGGIQEGETGKECLQSSRLLVSLLAPPPRFIGV